MCMEIWECMTLCALTLTMVQAKYSAPLSLEVLRTKLGQQMSHRVYKKSQFSFQTICKLLSTRVDLYLKKIVKGQSSIYKERDSKTIPLKGYCFKKGRALWEFLEERLHKIKLSGLISLSATLSLSFAEPNYTKIHSLR